MWISLHSQKLFGAVAAAAAACVLLHAYDVYWLVCEPRHIVEFQSKQFIEEKNHNKIQIDTQIDTHHLGKRSEKFIETGPKYRLTKKYASNQSSELVVENQFVSYSIR